MTRLAVLASGTGSNLQAVLEACAHGELTATVVVVVSDRAGVPALARGRQAGVPPVVCAPGQGESRHDYGARLADVVAAFTPDWVVLAGWRRVLSTRFLDRFPGRVVNLHPALPGAFPGLHAIERAYAASRAGTLDHTGVMVHLVPDEGVDDGPVLACETVPVHATDTLADLKARVHAAEHRLLVGALAALLSATMERT